MESEVRQLVEMGATMAQARAALKRYKDVMQAAERIFDGQFDDVMEDDEQISAPVSSKTPSARPTTHDDDEDMEDAEDDDDDEFIDYDSDDAPETNNGRRTGGVDPYAVCLGIFFSKSRKEEVIEIQEEPETATITGVQLTLLSQGDWMRGCPEGSEQSFLFSLYSQLTEGQCVCSSGCGWSVPRKKSDFFGIFPEFSAFIDHLRRIVSKTCPRCKALFCFACGESAEYKSQRPGTGAHDDPLFHCSNLQGVILGVGLYMLQQLFEAQKSGVADLKDSSSKKRKAAVTVLSNLDDDEDDAYYGGAHKNPKKGGIGYAGAVKEDHSGQLEARNIQKARDEDLANLLGAIRVFIPSIEREGGGHPSDFLPHPTTLAHLRRRFTHVCSPMLRNDSLSDMSDRNILYFELFEWLEIVSKHESLASMMAMPLMVPISSKPLPPKKGIIKSDTHQRERVITYEGSSSPRELLESISIQANAALKGLEGPKVEVIVKELTEEEKRMTTHLKGKEKEATVNISADNQKLIEFCRRILATIYGIDRSLKDTKGDQFVQRLHDSLPKISNSSSAHVFVQVGKSEESRRAAYIDWATRVRFEYCDLALPPTTMNNNEDEDDIPHYKFYFNNEARLLANQSIPKRSLAIAKELAVLTTNLPVAYDSSIFLRVDETRVDIIKALITGPEGTPYQGGCYLFDIFLGGTYNQSAPSVKYMTTGGGRYRFNPNLYADGKVCLSLLGTWSGPGWIPYQSTLLQVLISIQSMILCEEPYLNEPGWANSAGTPQSIAYSNNVKRMVVKIAMLGNLKNPPEPFEDIIKTHFRLKARAITAQLDDWLAKDDGKTTTSDGGGYNGGDNTGGSGASFARDVTELKERLRELEKQVA